MKIREVQRQIVKALETGQNPAPLLKKLAELRAEQAAQIEIEELAKVATERIRLRDQAEIVKDRIIRQGEAIDTFLKARDSVTEALQPILELAAELPRLQEECYSQFHDLNRLAWNTKLPEGYLDMKVPMLEMGSGLIESYDVSKQALFYLQAGYGLLADLVRHDRDYPQRPAGEMEVIDEDPDPPCRVCQHPERAAIDRALVEGKSLREIASQYEVSKSTVDRHKAHLRREPESPAASSNATFFRG